ncbi:hypothetical protein [Rhodoblastus sp.]|jgi:hypothetical protein|uniref:hypothetical protein n=1 Tax=Rhodoblastus sp. TaxID=1962975 RepID=UPI002615870F|nr:hypothetical protein [Rhodoblastus sp.]
MEQKSNSGALFFDNVQAVGVHNGVARIALIRLASDGKPVPVLELLIPTTQVPQVIKALQQIR